MRLRTYIFAVLGLGVALPFSAAADVIDDFTVVGGGYTIKFSEPATVLVMDHPHEVYVTEPFTGTINGVPGYTGSLQIATTNLGSLPSLVLDSSLFSLALYGPIVDKYVVVPTSNPIPVVHPDDLLVTNTPGVYALTAGIAPPFTGDPFTVTITQEATTGAPTPEPGTLVLLSTGLAGLLWQRRSR